MSFDLYVFDDDSLAATAVSVEAALDDETGWNGELTPRLAAFIAELEGAFFPGLDDDPDHSPWSSWPLSGNSAAGGRCCGFNIAWSAADRMSVEMRERARRHGLALYDPQAREILKPPALDDGRRKSRRLFRRG